jgi:hypothetical protein
MTLDELKASLGPAAVAAAYELAENAPPLTPEQRAELAVILRRPRIQRATRLRRAPAA